METDTKYILFIYFELLASEHEHKVMIYFIEPPLYDSVWTGPGDANSKDLDIGISEDVFIKRRTQR